MHAVVRPGVSKVQLKKCPRCELNYIAINEKYCNVCRKELKGEYDADEQPICIECGENPALSGQELCADCLREKRRQEKLEKLQTTVAASELTLDSVDQLDEIDVPSDTDIPTEELQEIDKEFGDTAFAIETDGSDN